MENKHLLKQVAKPSIYQNPEPQNVNTSQRGSQNSRARQNDSYDTMEPDLSGHGFEKKGHKRKSTLGMIFGGHKASNDSPSFSSSLASDSKYYKNKKKYEKEKEKEARKLKNKVSKYELRNNIDARKIVDEKSLLFYKNYVENKVDSLRTGAFPENYLGELTEHRIHQTYQEKSDRYRPYYSANHVNINKISNETSRNESETIENEKENKNKESHRKHKSLAKTLIKTIIPFPHHHKHKHSKPIAHTASQPQKTDKNDEIGKIDKIDKIDKSEESKSNKDDNKNNNENKNKKMNSKLLPFQSRSIDISRKDESVASLKTQQSQSRTNSVSTFDISRKITHSENDNYSDDTTDDDNGSLLTKEEAASYGSRTYDGLGKSERTEQTEKVGTISEESSKEDSRSVDFTSTVSSPIKSVDATKLVAPKVEMKVEMKDEPSKSPSISLSGASNSIIVKSKSKSRKSSKDENNNKKTETNTEQKKEAVTVTERKLKAIMTDKSKEIEHSSPNMRGFKSRQEPKSDKVGSTPHPKKYKSMDDENRSKVLNRATGLDGIGNTGIENSIMDDSEIETDEYSENENDNANAGTAAAAVSDSELTNLVDRGLKKSSKMLIDSSQVGKSQTPKVNSQLKPSTSAKPLKGASKHTTPFDSTPSDIGLERQNHLRSKHSNLDETPGVIHGRRERSPSQVTVVAKSPQSVSMGGAISQDATGAMTRKSIEDLHGSKNLQNALLNELVVIPPHCQSCEKCNYLQQNITILENCIEKMDSRIIQLQCEINDLKTNGYRLNGVRTNKNKNKNRDNDNVMSNNNNNNNDNNDDDDNNLMIENDKFVDIVWSSMVASYESFSNWVLSKDFYHLFLIKLWVPTKHFVHNLLVKLNIFEKKEKKDGNDVGSLFDRTQWQNLYHSLFSHFVTGLIVIPTLISYLFNSGVYWIVFAFKWIWVYVINLFKDNWQKARVTNTVESENEPNEFIYTNSHAPVVTPFDVSTQQTYSNRHSTRRHSRRR